MCEPEVRTLRWKLNQWTQADVIQSGWWRILDYDLFTWRKINRNALCVSFRTYNVCTSASLMQRGWWSTKIKAVLVFTVLLVPSHRTFSQRWTKCMLYQTSPFTLSLSWGKLYIAIFVSLYADVCVHWQGGCMLTGLWADADQTGRQGGWMSGHSQQVVWMR